MKKVFKTHFDKVTRLLLLTFTLLILLSYMPEISWRDTVLGSYTIKKINLTSEIKKERLNSSPALLDNMIDTIIGSQRVASTVSESLLEDEVSETNKEAVKANQSETLDKNLLSVRFEDYSTTNDLSRLVSSLKNIEKSDSPMRIAFLGDSFIEADILTADVRSLLQSNYGGKGVGFIPITSPASKYRYTIDHTFDGWKAYSMVNYKEADWKYLTLPGFYYVPSEKATMSIKNKKIGKEQTTCRSAKLLFINEKNTEINVRVNEGEVQTFTPPSSPRMQSVDLTGDIYSVDFSFKNVAGFVGFGTVLDDRKGVYVDNYSVRGSSGVVLSTVDQLLSNDFDSIVHSDVIVLQYGLNVAAAHITNYSYYKRTMVRVIDKLRGYFPNTCFIIMGVGDRAMKDDANRYETMPEIIAMVGVQREIAKEAKCIFWDTFMAMGGRNSMATYVSHNPPLAHKDYTHINHAGGKKIANAFVSSLLNEVERIDDTPRTDTR